MYVAIKGKAYVTTDLMYITTHSENVLKSAVFNENQLVSKRNNVIIPAPSYARRSGHRHCPPAYQ